MACCGKQREQIRATQSDHSNTNIMENGMETKRVAILFEYKGNSNLTVHGLISGKQYSFERPGAIVEVDSRDRNLLLAMPSLRQL
jgi:hypothetical protein